MTASTERVLNTIVNRIRYVRSKLFQAAEILLQRAVKVPEQITLQDFENLVEYWCSLVPDTTEEKAQLIHALVERYGFMMSGFSATQEVLGVTDSNVQRAYEKLFGQSIEIQIANTEVDAVYSETVEDLLTELRWCYLERGETLYEQGAPSNELYGVVDGLLRAIVTEKNKTSLTVDIYPGEIVGEEAIISGTRRSASVVALQDSDLVSFSRESYERLVTKYPLGMARLGMQLVQRMQRITGMASPPSSSRAVVILPLSNNVGEFAARLEQKLSEQVSTLRLHPEQLPDGVESPIEDVVNDYTFLDWFRTQQMAHGVVLFEAHAEFPNWTRRIINLADRILLVGWVDDNSDSTVVDDILENLSKPQFTAPRELVLMHRHKTTGTFNTEVWLDRHNVSRHHHVALDDDDSLRRVVRFLRGDAVGIVFGGGGIRAAAHLGAIRALHEQGYAIDAVGGTSSGAIIAGMAAMGWSVDRITEVMRKKMLQRSVMFNPTFPIVSLSSAHGLSKAYKEIFGDVMMEDLWTSCYTISANMTQTKPSINSRGLLRKAVRYSTSIAGLYPPTPDPDGDIHIDGGVVNNTPADVMRQFIGQGTNIAIDLGFTERETSPYHYGDSLSGWSVLWRRLNPLVKPFRIPNMLMILMRSNALASMNMTEEQMSHADLIVRPPVSGYGLFDFSGFDDLIDVGYKATLKALQDFNPPKQ